jgi:hypothetical protein
VDNGGEMKKLSCAILAALLVVGMFSICHAEGANYLKVYYFYTDVRCKSCHNIEMYTKETLEQYFKSDMDSGRLTFEMLNTDKAENAHFKKDYGLFTKSVVLSLVKDGKEVKFGNLGKVWELLGNKKKFQEYIKAEVEKYLKEL